MNPQSQNIIWNEYDDLTAIKGIKQARQQWFRDTFKVLTFRDLASLNVDEIEARLKAEKQIPSRNKIEGWLAEATRLAENPGLATATQANPHSSEEAWKPFASFVVEFQEQESSDQVEWRTRVHHVETDQTHTWPDVEQQNLCRWMMQQLGDRAVVSPVSQENPESMPLPVEKSAPPIGWELPTQPGQSAFSPHLQEILAKAVQASQPSAQANTQVAPFVTQTPADASLFAEAQAEVTIASAASISSERPQTGYSDKLQQILSKAQRLSSKQT